MRTFKDVFKEDSGIYQSLGYIAETAGIIGLIGASTEGLELTLFPSLALYLGGRIGGDYIRKLKNEEVKEETRAKRIGRTFGLYP